MLDLSTVLAVPGRVVAQRAAMTGKDMLVKVLQPSVDDEKGFGVMSIPSLRVRRMAKAGLNRSMGPIPGR